MLIICENARNCFGFSDNSFPILHAWYFTKECFALFKDKINQQKYNKYQFSMIPEIILVFNTAIMKVNYRHNSVKDIISKQFGFSVNRNICLNHLKHMKKNKLIKTFSVSTWQQVCAILSKQALVFSKQTLALQCLVCKQLI